MRQVLAANHKRVYRGMKVHGLLIVRRLAPVIFPCGRGQAATMGAVRLRLRRPGEGATLALSFKFKEPASF